MAFTAVKFYSPKMWDWLYTYRFVILLWRMAELEFTLLKYYLLKAPLLMIWTRAPVLKDRQPPIWKGPAGT